jgi:hypothetical protein
MMPAIILALLAAQSIPCGADAKIEAALADRYGEVVQLRGIVEGGRQMLVLTANAKTGTWTVLVLDGSGGACVVAAGDAYTPGVEPLPPNG